MNKNRKISFLFLTIILFSIYLLVLGSTTPLMAKTNQIIDTSTSTTPLGINEPLTTPPICDQPQPYRLVTPPRVFPEQDHLVFFEFCNNYNNYIDIEPIVQVRQIDSGDSGWRNVTINPEQDLFLWNRISTSLEEYSYRSTYYFTDCTAIEGRFLLVTLGTYQAKTPWTSFEIPTLWACGPPSNEGVDLSTISILGFIGVITIGAVFAVSKGRNYIASLPKIERYQQFVKLRNISRHDLSEHSNIDKRYRIVSSGADGIELYRKDGRTITDDDYNDIMETKYLIDKK